MCFQEPFQLHFIEPAVLKGKCYFKVFFYLFSIRDFSVSTFNTLCLRSSRSARSQRRDKAAFSKSHESGLYESETPGEVQSGLMVLQTTLYSSLGLEKVKQAHY